MKIDKVVTRTKIVGRALLAECMAMFIILGFGDSVAGMHSPCPALRRKRGRPGPIAHHPQYWTVGRFGRTLSLRLKMA